jgi:hypothetical protein
VGLDVETVWDLSNCSRTESKQIVRKSNQTQQGKNGSKTKEKCWRKEDLHQPELLVDKEHTVVARNKVTDWKSIEWESHGARSCCDTKRRGVVGRRIPVGPSCRSGRRVTVKGRTIRTQTSLESYLTIDSMNLCLSNDTFKIVKSR